MKDVKAFIEENGLELLKIEKENKDDVGILIVRDKYGYLYDTTLRSLLNDKYLSWNHGWGRFALRNIERFLIVNNLPFELCDGNVFVDWKQFNLQFHCKKCDEYFYMNWETMKKKTKKSMLCENHPLSDEHYILRSEGKSFVAKEDHADYTDAWVIDWDTVLNQKSKIPFDSKIALELKKYCISKYEATHEYLECINPTTGFYLPYDIYIPTYKLYIEVQGSQHTEFIESFHGNRANFEYQVYRDKIKKEHALNNGYFLEIDLRYTKTIEKAISLVEDKIQDIFWKS